MFGGQSLRGVRRKSSSPILAVLPSAHGRSPCIRVSSSSQSFSWGLASPLAFRSGPATARPTTPRSGDTSSSLSSSCNRRRHLRHSSSGIPSPPPTPSSSSKARRSFRARPRLPRVRRAPGVAVGAPALRGPPFSAPHPERRPPSPAPPAAIRSPPSLPIPKHYVLQCTFLAHRGRPVSRAGQP